ncbi:MAG: hypothetical protein ACR2GN_09490 [Bacteroidia bacterium]
MKFGLYHKLLYICRINNKTMNTNPQQFPPEDSFRVINEMINAARKNFTRISFFFLLWGWLLLAAGIAEFFLFHSFNYEYAWMVWPAMGIIGGIISGIHSKKQEKNAGSVSFMDKLFSYLWIGFFFTLILIIVGTVSQNQLPHSLIMILTGMPTFVTGRILKFKPLIIGGVVFWIIGILSLYLYPQYISITFSIAILLGYIIPGYMLMKQEINNV